MPPSLEWTEIIHAVLLPLNDILETRSHLFILLRTRLRPYFPYIGLTIRSHPIVFNKVESESRRWQVTAGICRRIAEEFSDRLTPVIFLLIPTKVQVQEDLWHDHLAAFGIAPSSVSSSQPNVLLRKAFDSAGLTLLDPLEYLRQEADSLDLLYGAVDPHLNRKGNRSVAEFILPIVETALRLPN